MALFEFTSGGKVIVKKDLVDVPEFKKILSKKDWEKRIAFIFHTADYTSPYASYTSSERSEKLKDDFLDGKEPDRNLKEAIEKYRELSTTDSLLLLESARNAVKKMRNYFDTVDPQEEEDVGRATKDLMTNLNNVGKLINNLKEWEEIVKKEKQQDQIRKGVRRTKYNTN